MITFESSSVSWRVFNETLPPRSQGARGKTSTGPSRPLCFAAVDRKGIFRPSISYGVSLVAPAMGRLMRWILDVRECGVGQAGRHLRLIHCIDPGGPSDRSKAAKVEFRAFTLAVF